MTSVAIFDYKTPFVLNALADGEHKSKRQGLGSDFYKKSSFLSEPNPARVDLASSLTDPFGSLYVKSYRQRSQLDVQVLVDGSSSMNIADKHKLVGEFEKSIAASVAARSDKYRVYLVRDKLHEISRSEMLDELHEISRSEMLDEQLSGEQEEHSNDAIAFYDVERILPQRKSLVFIVSDFHWSTEKLKHVLTSLTGHYLVPIVLWCSAEFESYKLWRFVQIHDAETGANRLIFVSPKQKQRIVTEFEQHRAQLNQFFQQFSCRPFWAIDEFNIDDLRAFFYGS